MLALSVRQPWAWLIIHAGKDFENREWTTRYRGRVLIHASKGMTRIEYADAVHFTNQIRVSQARAGNPTLPEVPTFNALERGGVIGSVEIVDVLRWTDDYRERTIRRSPWFVGTYGWKLKDPKALPFNPGPGRLGLFYFHGKANR